MRQAGGAAKCAAEFEAARGRRMRQAGGAAKRAAGFEAARGRHMRQAGGAAKCAAEFEAARGRRMWRTGGAACCPTPRCIIMQHDTGSPPHQPHKLHSSLTDPHECKLRVSNLLQSSIFLVSRPFGGITWTKSPLKGLIYGYIRTFRPKSGPVAAQSGNGKYRARHRSGDGAARHGGH